MCINVQQNRVETQVVTVLKLKANISLAFKNSEKHRHTITLYCITPSLEIYIMTAWPVVVIIPCIK